MKQSDKKVSFDDPQNGGHFSCRKPVSHVGTSTVSDSEALIHLAYVQHMWQSNLLLFWKAWPGGIELCSKMQLAGNDYRCILICMFACWKKFCYAALTAKTFANFAPFLDRKMEVEKWTQKWCQNLTPKMGSKNGTQKGGPIFFWFKKDLQEIKAFI